MKKEFSGWALSRKFDHGRHFLGPYCWNPGDCARGTLGVALFPTRAEARAAKRLCCYRRTSRVERVRLTIETVQD